MSDTPYDVVVIGAGPGGYVAAIRCRGYFLRPLVFHHVRTRSGRPLIDMMQAA